MIFDISSFDNNVYCKVSTIAKRNGISVDSLVSLIQITEQNSSKLKVRMSSSGRKRAAIWNDFEELPTSGKGLLFSIII